VRWGQLPATDQASDKSKPPTALMTTLIIEGGRQDKLRAGDLLGALTGDVGLPGDAVGKIDIGAQRAYVAIRSDRAEVALQGLRAGKIKGKAFRVYRLGPPK
jgi:ATP-independent RNA helicase DbpA